MSAKEIIILTVFLVFTVPTLFAIFGWSLDMFQNPNDPNKLNKGIEIAANEAVPWWLGIFALLAKLPSFLAAVAIIAFVIFLKYAGEIK